MQVVLVTGGAGYVGSHACKALARAGFLPVVYDDLSSGHRELVRWGPLEVGDVLDAPRLATVIQRHGPVAVMHFAAFSTVAESVRDPAACYRTNVLGSAALLETMREHGVRHLVFSSTAAVYGIPARCPVAEDSRLDPINPYGRSKLAVERMIADYGAAYGLNWMALRYFNAAGADPEGETGEMHDPETHLIPRALMAAGGQLPELEVFGDDYDTADGSCLRDYVHVSDLAEAHLAALAHLMAGGASQALNLGTGRGQTAFKVIRTVERVTGRAVPLRVGPRRPGDPPVLVADAGRAAAVLGCKFRFTELEQIVATAWEWHRRRA